MTTPRLLFPALLLAAACGGSTSSGAGASPAPSMAAGPPSPDPRIGLKPGATNAGEAVWNLRVLAKTPSPPNFAGKINSDLAFTGKYAIQGSFNGYQVWDISDPSKPALKTAYVCPASQSDVSVYRNLLIVSGEDLAARIDCGTVPVQDPISKDRLRGIRIFDISDIEHPKNVGNVQTCRGSHTHSLLVDPRDAENVYVYISGSSQVRPSDELAGCSRKPSDPNSALFRIEVIKVPLAHPEQAAIVSSPRIFANLAPPPTHGMTALEAVEAKRMKDSVTAAGGYVITVFGETQPLPDGFARMLLDSLVKVRGGTGNPTAADSATLRREVQGIVDKLIAAQMGGGDGPPTGPTQCHDITLYPAVGYAGGACEGYGFLLDIRDPAHPVRITEVADSNFSYWHSATFNNDGTKLLFSDEWGGGGAPKCRASDPKEWGADALFSIENRKLVFKSYYKMPAPQTPLENCVAHNGSLLPIPGRDVMVQAWYQGGISVFDWTDAAHPKEIAFFDRGPFDSTRMLLAGSWSVYWYNGAMYSSEILRGLDVFELIPSPFISANEIAAAKTVHLDYLNTQGQPKFVWPPSFALARAYLDQAERGGSMSNAAISAARKSLSKAEKASGSARKTELDRLAGTLSGAVADAVRRLAAAG